MSVQQLTEKWCRLSEVLQWQVVRLIWWHIKTTMTQSVIYIKLTHLFIVPCTYICDVIVSEIPSHAVHADHPQSNFPAPSVIADRPVYRRCAMWGGRGAMSAQPWTSLSNLSVNDRQLTGSSLYQTAGGTRPTSTLSLPASLPRLH